MQSPDIPKDAINTEDHQDFEFDVASFENVNSLIQSEEDITKKTVPYIEREVRNSYEYRSYIQYLKEELDLTKCSFLPGLDAKEVGISLEFHHFPMNLYEISEAVLKAKIEQQTEESPGVSLFDVAEEIVKEHFQNNIGLVPLSETLHEMAHNRSIIIPVDKVYGNYRNFMNKYAAYIPQEIKDRISDAEAYNGDPEVQDFNKQKLEKRINHYKAHYDNEAVVNNYEFPKEENSNGEQQ